MKVLRGLPCRFLVSASFEHSSDLAVRAFGSPLGAALVSALAAPIPNIRPIQSDRTSCFIVVSRRVSSSRLIGRSARPVDRLLFVVERRQMQRADVFGLEREA